MIAITRFVVQFSVFLHDLAALLRIQQRHDFLPDLQRLVDFLFCIRYLLRVFQQHFYYLVHSFTDFFLLFLFLGVHLLLIRFQRKFLFKQHVHFNRLAFVDNLVQTILKHRFLGCRLRSIRRFRCFGIIFFLFLFLVVISFVLLLGRCGLLFGSFLGGSFLFIRSGFAFLLLCSNFLLCWLKRMPIRFGCDRAVIFYLIRIDCNATHSTLAAKGGFAPSFCQNLAIVDQPPATNKDRASRTSSMAVADNESIIDHILGNELDDTSTTKVLITSSRMQLNQLRLTILATCFQLSLCVEIIQL
mmetsp:Transcript_63928/g.101756  ORF Transcript_63928/g.101756 Transcript_63928/m.101756 type:complete len:301 (-) Transcript_63928:493-1395(-)